MPFYGENVTSLRIFNPVKSEPVDNKFDRIISNTFIAKLSKNNKLNNNKLKYNQDIFPNIIGCKL